MSTIAKRVKQARAHKGLKTHGDLGDLIGVSAQTIQAIEAGVTKKSRYLADIARVCEVRERWLVAGEGDMLVDYPPSPPPLTGQENDLVGLFRGLGPAERGTMLGIARTMVENLGTARPFRPKKRA